YRTAAADHGEDRPIRLGEEAIAEESKNVPSPSLVPHWLAVVAVLTARVTLISAQSMPATRASTARPASASASNRAAKPRLWASPPEAVGSHVSAIVLPSLCVR